MPRPVASTNRLVKPTLETPFHIDYEWWTREGRDLRVYLHSHLCAHHRDVFSAHDEEQLVDWVDDVTAEVTRVNGIEHALRVHCSQQPDYIAEYTTLVDAVFRVFLANGNTPLTAPQLAQKTGRSADVILRTLSGARVYEGLRPIVES